jgi:hypothetical protein
MASQSAVGIFSTVRGPGWPSINTEAATPWDNIVPNTMLTYQTDLSG